MRYQKIKLNRQAPLLLIAFIFVFMCSPLSFLIAADNTSVQSFFNVAKIVLFVLGFIYVVKARVYSKMTLCIFGYVSIYILSTILNNGNLRTAFNICIGILGVYLWSEFFICKMPNMFLRTYLNYMFIMIVANLVTTILFPMGLSLNKYNGYEVRLIGIDNSLASMLYPTVIISYLQYYRKKIDKSRVKTLLAIVIATEFLVFSATSIIGLIPILWGFYVLNGKEHDLKFDLNLKKIILFYFAAFYFINVSLSNSIVTTFIANVFHKSVNFSGRTYIWEKSLEIISSRILWVGYGAYDKELLRTMYFLPANCHSFLFELIIDVGISGLLLFGYMCFLAYKRALRYCSKNRGIVRCLLCYLMTILTMGIAEATSVYLANFMFLAIFYHSNMIKEEEISS